MVKYEPQIKYVHVIKSLFCLETKRTDRKEHLKTDDAEQKPTSKPLSDCS